MNPNKSKLQPEKTGPAIILKVNENNNYLVQGLGPHFKTRHFITTVSDLALLATNSAQPLTQSQPIK